MLLKLNWLQVSQTPEDEQIAEVQLKGRETRQERAGAGARGRSSLLSRRVENLKHGNVGVRRAFVCDAVQPNRKPILFVPIPRMKEGPARPCTTLFHAPLAGRLGRSLRSFRLSPSDVRLAVNSARRGEDGGSAHVRRRERERERERDLLRKESASQSIEVR